MFVSEATKDPKRPTPKQIDDLIFQYSVLQTAAIAAGVTAKKASTDADVVKAEIVTMVGLFGAPHAKKSKRLVGLLNKAVVTYGTGKSTDTDAVDRLKAYTDGSKVSELTELLFSKRVTYELVEQPAEVIKTLEAPTRIRTKLTTLLALCFKTKPKAPSLAVEVVEVGS